MFVGPRGERILESQRLRIQVMEVQNSTRLVDKQATEKLFEKYFGVAELRYLRSTATFIDAIQDIGNIEDVLDAVELGERLVSIGRRRGTLGKPESSSAEE